MRAAALVLMLSAAPVAAESFVLHWPLDCTLGQDCFIEDYVDDDPAPGQQRDFACGLNSRDAHKGTDLALISFDLMERGVAVRAAAPGTVLRLRDSMADDRLMTGVTDQNACGNAVLIDHGDGWQTLSCHMKRGSVAVTPGQTVATGDLLGEVGLSGQTNHPHLHLTVLHNGTEVDPFAPDAALPCGPQEVTLWADPPPYTATGLVTAGFSAKVPDLAEVTSGTARRDSLGATEPLVVYGHVGHGEPGDVLVLSARGPDGAEVFRERMVLEDPQVSLMRAFGRKAPPQGWAMGDYLGEALLTRDGVVIAHRHAHVTVR
ncbi:M23 family metallopeptidase [Salipiger marinus]|uniref:Peptidase family M23 n=1 Tax=Salipiger marinus TaxID=555512 RepID=A0A1G8HU59_9RHOB|nr:M23 family metallopeptidase [Salipiger marinus]SDI10031.1 Peptidase family M23 [Salipiger marinus]